MKTKFPPGLAILASVNFVFATFLAAHSVAQSTQDALHLTITSSSGAERHPGSRGKIVDWVVLSPNQSVSVILQLPTSYADQPVVFSRLDGGELSAEEDLLVSSEGIVQCTFQGASTLGLYRVLVQIGTEQYLLQFYVIDPGHPEKNPAGLQAVE